MDTSTRFLAATLLAAACGLASAQEASTAKVPLGLPRAAQSSLPDLGSTANTLLSRADEYQIGRMMMSDLRSQNLLLDDPETADYLQSLGDRIGAEAQEGETRLTFVPIRDRTLNAFALPGGFVGLHTGLILLTTSESELAAVVAHEVGHVVQRHMARAVQADGRIGLTSIATTLGAVLLGILTGSPDATMGVMSVGQATAMQQQINFTRMEEHEADRVGIGYLAAAGFDPGGMPAFFSTMMRERGIGGDDDPALLLTHPTDPVRIAEARARVASMPAYPRRTDSATYPYIRERLRVVASTPESDQRRYFENMRKTDPSNPSLQYGQALAEMKAGNGAKAVTLLKPLVAAQPQLPLLHAALGQAQLLAGDKEAAVQTFEHALKLSPRNVPLSVRYAETLLKLDSAKKAHLLLLDLFNNVTPTAEQIRLIALAASTAGDTADAYYYMGELHISNGDLMLATTQLDMALNAPGITEVQRKRFTARRDEIRDFLREQRGDRSSRPPRPG